MIAKKMSVVLLALVTLCVSIQAQEQKKSVKRNGVEQTRACCKKSTCAPTIISSARVIDESGPYCLSRDIVGTIVIAADDVMLDLNSHHIDADGNAYAISMQDVHNVKVFNGSILNASDAGIFVDPSAGITLSNLYMAGNQLDAIRLEESKSITVENVTFIGDQGGERGLNAIVCRDINVHNCSASGFLSTIGAIIELNECHGGRVHNVDVFSNTKTASADVFYFDPGSAFVAVSFSDGIELKQVKANNNIFNNTVVVDPNENFRTSSAILFGSCTSCLLNDSETCNNLDIAGTSANQDSEDFIVCLLGCENCTVTNHKSNNNRCEPESIAYFSAIAVFDSASVVLDGCQANGNFVQEISVIPGFEAPYDVILFGSFFAPGSSRSNVIKNSQANFNSAGSLGAGRDDSISFLVGIEAAGASVDNCQANYNSVLASNPLTYSIGIATGGNAAFVTNSTANNNTGGEFAVGINLFGNAPTIVENCTANSNNGYGLLIGFPYFSLSTKENQSIINSTFSNNNHEALEAAGIAVYPLWTVSNLVIKDCQINGTESGSNSVAGINIPSGSNVHIEGCNVFDTVSTNSLSATIAGIYVSGQGANIVIENTDVFNSRAAGELVVMTNPAILPPIPAVLAAYSPLPFTASSGAGEVVIDTMPPTDNACSIVTNDLTGKIGVCRRGECAFTIKTENIEDAGAVGTIVVNSVPGAPIVMPGNQTGLYPSVMISLADGNALINALALNPGTNVSIVMLYPEELDANGIVFDSINDSKIIRCQVHGNQNAGIRLTGLLNNITVLDCIAKGNDKGFTVPGELVDGLFQGNRAQGNTTTGFEQPSLFQTFNTVYQNNYAQNNTLNYSIGNVIQRHEYNISTATYTFAEGNTDLPEFTNIDAF